MRWISAAFIAVLALPRGSSATQAEEIDAASQEALAKTQEMLRDPQARAKAVSQSAQGAYVDQQVRSLAGSAQNADAIYDLTAEIVGDLVEKSGGDVSKMKAFLEQAKDDPAGFADQLSSAELAKLKEIAGRTPASGAAPVRSP